MKPSVPRRSRRISASILAFGAVIALGSALAFLAAGCAAPLAFAASADPLSVLEPGATAYARFDGVVARELLPSALPPAAAKSLSPVLARTRLVALAMGSPGAELQACLVGDYPFRAASLSFGSDPAWKREKAGYFNAKLGLRAAVPGPNLVFATTGLLEPLFAGAKAPGPSPIPARLSTFASHELVIWIPEPFSRLAASLFGESMDVPAMGMLIAADPRGTDYDATIVFLMKDADSARIFRPALRLAWYAIARGLLGGDDSALAPDFKLEGDLYRASGLVLSGAFFARVLDGVRGGGSALGGGGLGSGNDGGVGPN